MPRETFHSSRFHYTFGPHEPTLTVPSGASIRVVCPDSGNVMSDGSTLKPEQRQGSDGTALFEGNPMAGPIHVQGAGEGDCLAVEIEAVDLDRIIGRTGLAPGHGFLPDHLLAPHRIGEPVPSHLYEWEVDTDSGTASLRNGRGDVPITVRLDPFIGCIGVCPQWGQSVSTLYGGIHGGNVDVPFIRPGCTILLPVWHEGGLLMMGDLHGAQGDGEIIGGAIEISGKVDCRVTTRKNRTLPSPRAVTAAHVYASGVDGELRSAIQEAYAHLVNWLSDELQLNRWDAYNLISQVGSVSLGNLLMAPYVAWAGIRLDALPDATREEFSRWNG